MQIPPFRMGIDLGGTKIEAAILNPQNEVLFRERIPTEAHLGPEHILNQIASLYKKACLSISENS